MSQTIENRIVEMQFENKQFESGVQESLTTLDKLKNALKFEDASKNLQDFSKNINQNIDLSGLSKSVEEVGSRFSASGIAGMEVIRKLTDFAIEAGKTIAHALDAPFAQIRQGGWKRAMNIEDAKFQLKGLGIAWETVADDINYAVADTAFGLDAAAKACSQLSASSVQAGQDMKAALRGISGVAAMGNTEYENIAQIFTKAAGNGKVMADELNRISQYGLNARASLSSFFNAIVDGDEKVADIPEEVKKNVMAITKGAHVAEADISEFASKSKISFQTFSYAMDSAFGEHAKKANETFMGSLRNIKAALSKIGAEFATPIIKGAIPIFNEIRVFLNDLRKHMTPIFEVFSKIAEIVSGKLTNALYKFRMSLLEFGAIDKIGNAIKNVFTSVVKIFVAVKNAFQTVFPPAHNFARVIDSMADGIENFSKHLVLSDGAMLAFRNVMIVVFNIVKALSTVIKNILPLIGKVASVILKIISVVVGLVGYLTTLVMQLDIVKRTMNAIQKAGGLFAYAIDRIKDVFSKLKVILTDTTTVTGRFFMKLKDIATTGAYLVGGALYLAFMKIKDVISYFNTKDPLGSLIQGVQTLISKFKELPVVKDIINGVEVAIGTVVVAINKAIETFVKFVNEIKNGKSIFEALGVVAVEAVNSIITAFTKLTDKVRSGFIDFFKGFSEDKIIEETFETPIANAGMALVGFEQQLTKTGSKIEDTNSTLDKGSGVLSSYEYQVKNTTTTLDKVRGSAASFATAILSTVKGISSSKVILTAYAGILMVIAFNTNLLIKKLSGLAGTLSGGFLSMFRAVPTRFDKFKVGLMAITAAIAALAASIYLLKDVPIDKLQEITKSLAILIGLTGGLSILAAVANQLLVKFSSSNNGFNLFSANMFMLAAGVSTIVLSLKLLDTVDMNNIWTKVMVLGSIGLGLTTFSILMGKFAPQLSLGSIFMVAFAASVLILVKALDNLSKVDLSGIVENYEELGAIIVSFAAFAALAGTVGISSLFSLIAFLLGMRTLLKSFDAIKDKLEEYHVGALLVGVCKKIKEEIKAALNYLKGMFDSMSEFDKKAIGWYIALSSGGFFLVLLGLSKAAKYVKKMAVSATILALAVAGVMVAVTKIAQACNSIPQSAIDKAITILDWVGGLFIAVIALSAIFGGDIDYGKDVFGKNAKGLKTKLGSRKFKRSGQTEYLKQARKMMADMAILLASVALFVNVVGKLSDDELERAIPVLVGTGLVVSALMIAITVIASSAKSAGRATASVAVFVGMIGVIGALLASIVILMNYFKDFDITSAKDWGQLAATIISMILIIGAVSKLTKALKVGRQQSGYKSILAFAALLTAVGMVVTYMTDNLSKDELGKAAGIAAALIVFTVVISGIVLGLEAFSNKLANTVNRRKAFGTTMTAIIAMIASFLLVGATLYSMASSDVDPWKMAGITTIITLTLAALSTIVLAIQHFSKDSLTSITKTSGPKLKKTLAMIVAFLLGFIALAVVFAAMQKIEPNVMASQMLTIIIALTALTALGLAIQHFVKSMKSDWATIGKSAAILAGMVALFTALALVFKYIINDIQTEGVLAKSQSIVLVLLELEILALAASVLGGGGAMAADIALGELTLLGMIALFGILSLAFMAMDKLKTEGIMKKSQTLILVLLELEVLALACAVLGGGGVGAADIALGELTLFGMVALFGILSLVFVVLDKIKTEGIMKKSQTMVLVLLELEVMLALLAVIAPLGMIAMAGMPGLLAVVAAMLGIAASIRLLGDMDLGRIQSTIDIFIDSLNKILGLAIINGAAGISLLTIAAGIGAIGVACGVAGVGLLAFSASVAALSMAIEKLSSTGPKVMAWFTSVSTGVATLSVTIMNSITGLSKSVVTAVRNLIIGVITAITAGGALIFAAAVGLGKKMKEGFDSVLKPKLWGADLVKTFAAGIMSNLGPIINAVTAVAKVIRSYLHFSNPDVGPLSDASTYMPDMMSLFGNGITSNMGSVLGPVGKVAEGIKNGFKGIDLSSAGQSIMATFTQGVASGSGPLYDQLNSIMSAFGMVSNRIAEFSKTWSSHSAQLSSTMDNYYSTLKSNATAADNEVKRLEGGLARLKTNSRHTSQGMGAMNGKLEEAKKKSEEAHKALKEFETGVVDAGEATEEAAKSLGDFGSAADGAKGSTTEIKDEIADFYDTMEGAISLFDEFNKQTELTSDQLLKNMQSQIDGMTDWANQIQKLAFMGIDQGLLQQLAEMGPQGYEYTNAFVNMTAEQLQQANNLYHQSLMLPGKVTSQIYGSYTIAGRSAASGFLMGMDRGQIKEAAVGFAHDVVDQMNIALDIVAGKYSAKTLESGKAVTEGVLDGIEDPQLRQNVTTAIKLLSDNNIKKGFDSGLFHPVNQMYTIGGNITTGIADGIEDPSAKGKAKKSVENLCGMIIMTAENMFDEHSPSKVFRKIGGFLTEGLGIGITDKTQYAVSSMKTTSSEIIDTMRDTINKANEALIDDIDEPVITPILDLSNIQDGSREINNMLSRNSAFSASRSFSNLQNEQWNNQSALLNATMDNSDVVGAINGLQEDVLSLKDAMTNIKMVLDTGTMVGAMTPAIDQQLGMRQVLAGRGI